MSARAENSQADILAQLRQQVLRLEGAHRHQASAVRLEAALTAQAEVGEVLLGEQETSEQKLLAERFLLEGASRLEKSAGAAVERISTGCVGLDQSLPHRGLLRGSLVEWLSGGRGDGAQLLALFAAREACRQIGCGGSLGKLLVVLDRERNFNPLVPFSLGIEPAQLLVLQPESEADELWALDQALRSPGVGAVWGVRERLDWRDFRRLQLAAESGGGVGLLIRPQRVRGNPSWADVQFAVQPMVLQPSLGALPKLSTEMSNWQLQVEITRCRGGTAGAILRLEIDEQASQLRMIAHDIPAPHFMPAITSVAYRPAVG